MILDGGCLGARVGGDGALKPKALDYVPDDSLRFDWLQSKLLSAWATPQPPQLNGVLARAVGFGPPTVKLIQVVEGRQVKDAP